MVYFIKDYGSGHIKIGYTKSGMDGVKKRLCSLQTSSPTKLEILAVMRGSMKKEKMVHNFFKDARVVGEWFKPTARLMNYILPLLENQHDESINDDDFYGIKNSRKAITLTIPKEIIEKISQISKVERRTFSNMVTFMLSEALNKLPLTTRIGGHTDAIKTNNPG